MVIPVAAKRQKRKVFCAEKILGMISPNNNNKKVSATVNTKNSAMGEWNSNTSIKNTLQSIIMVTLTKLLVIRIVANNRSVSSSKRPIFSSDGCLRSAIVLRSAGEREKKAISEAEAKPDTNNNTPAKTMQIKADKEGAVTEILLKTSANWHK